jgi:predicted regulator of Ras-like GTPase activity (Roadblock/LC7/MglB family)
MRHQRLAAILDGLNVASADISISIIMSEDGLALATAGAVPQDFDEDGISTFSAAIVHLSDKVMENFVGGKLERILAKSKAGYLLAIPVQRDAILAVLAKPKAELELIFVEMGRAADSIGYVFNNLAVEGSR